MDNEYRCRTLAMEPTTYDGVFSFKAAIGMFYLPDGRGLTHSYISFSDHKGFRLMILARNCG